MTQTMTSILRRIGVALVVLALSATATLASPAGAQDAVKAEKLKDHIQVKTKKTAAVVSGDTAWVAVSIRGKEDVDDVRFTATLPDGSVAYPTNTVDHSGPYNGYQLDRKETDYVAFQVTVPAGYDEKELVMELQATWTSDGQRMRGSETVKIPVVTYTGDPYTLLSESVSYSTADPAAGWVSVSFAGLAPRVESFQAAVSDPGGLDIYYPADTFTSLANDALLEDGETDVIRFRVGEEHWGGPVDVTLEVRYQLAGVSTTAFHALSLAPA